MSLRRKLRRARGEPVSVVSGVSVAQFSDPTALTGCTAVLLDPDIGGAVGGVDIRGSATATREIALLDPTAMQDEIHALVLTGGSAPGLRCVDGVIDFLCARGQGFPTRQGPVPLVPAAALFDLGIGDSTSPTAENARQACEVSARTNARGNVGAGTGACVGKVRGMDHAMKGGLGTAAITLSDGLAVAAIVAVNAFGDVRDPDANCIVAGARDDRQLPLDTVEFIAGGGHASGFTNTVLAVVATNARLRKPATTRIARSAQAGIARCVTPCATSLDGDVVFSLATGTQTTDDERTCADRVGAIASELIVAAVLDAVFSAESVGGVPASRDLDWGATD